MRVRGLLGVGICWFAVIAFVVGCGGDDSTANKNGAGSQSSSGGDNDNQPTDGGNNDDDDTDDNTSDGNGPGDGGTGDDDTGDDATGDNATGDNASGDDASGGSDEWGNLIVRFVYDGDAPAPQPVVPDGGDAAYCGEHDLFKEDLVVNQENNGIANIVGWLSVGRGEDPPAAHPSSAEAIKQPVVLDNTGCRFEPHMTIVQTGQTLIVKNSDDIGHNTKVNLLRNRDDAFNDNLPSGRQLEKSFSNAESLPMIVECTQHKWMTARLFIMDHAFVAKSDTDGKLVIPNLPVGTWNIRFNHEKPGNIQGVQIGMGETSRRGEVEITIKPGDNDLGEIKLPASMFADR